MARKTYLLFLLLISEFMGCQLAFAQKEGNNWYFGYKAGLSFNTNPPQVLFNGQNEGKIGNASISDKNGNLLFYFGGGYNKAIYNRNHVPMLNGSGFNSLGLYSLI